MTRAFKVGDWVRRTKTFTSVEGLHWQKGYEFEIKELWKNRAIDSDNFKHSTSSLELITKYRWGDVYEAANNVFTHVVITKRLEAFVTCSSDKQSLLKIANDMESVCVPKEECGKFIYNVFDKEKVFSPDTAKVGDVYGHRGNTNILITKAGGFYWMSIYATDEECRQTIKSGSNHQFVEKINGLPFVKNVLNESATPDCEETLPVMQDTFCNQNGMRLDQSNTAEQNQKENKMLEIIKTTKQELPDGEEVVEYTVNGNDLSYYNSALMADLIRHSNAEAKALLSDAEDVGSSKMLEEAEKQVSLQAVLVKLYDEKKG